MFSEAIGELVIAALAMRHVEVGHPRGELVVGLIDLVPATAHAIVAKRVAIALILFRLTLVLLILGMSKFIISFFNAVFFRFCDLVRINWHKK